MRASPAPPIAEPTCVEPRTRIPWWLVVANGGLAFAVTVLTLLFWRSRESDLPSEELRMLRLVYRQVMQDHVEPHDGGTLVRDAIIGMVEKLDGYSAFVPPDEVGAFDTLTTGEYQGIGVTLVPGRAPITVHFPMEGGPAERAGIGVGDRIVGIDGEALTDLAPDQAIAAARKRLLGVPGSTVQLSIERPDGAHVDVTLERADVQQRSVKWVRLVDRDARIGYIFIGAFQHRTASEFEQALQDLEAAAGGRLGGLIVDVRFNLGGLLTESVTIANRFLRAGNIVSLRSRNDVEQNRIDVDPKKTTHPDLPLVVLVNEKSASASEVLCGALQDHGRAKVVGKRTWGKGVVQSIYRWEGLDFRLKLTTSRYYTPNGRNIGSKMRGPRDGKATGGIAPDVEVEITAKALAELERHLEDNEVPARYKGAAKELADELNVAGEPVPLGPEQDIQLARAIEMCVATATAGTQPK